MADQPREHLFRDEGGAALERAARLQDENNALRAEVERLKGPSRDATTLPSSAIGRSKPIGSVVAVTVVGMMLGALTASRQHHVRPIAVELPRPIPMRTHVLAPPPLTVGSPPIEVAPPLDDCSTVYWYDASGVKHYKPRCLRNK